MTQELKYKHIESEDKEGNEQYTPLKYGIRTYPADYTLEVLHDKLLHDEIIIPKFQRKNVWKLNQASRLIESFIMGLPVPPIFLFLDNDQNLLVVDGKQRLETISGFFNNKFENNNHKPFKLTGINKDSIYFNKSFSELRENDQKKLKRMVLRAIITEQTHPDNDYTSMYHIFERLNTGGTELKEQEIRNCVYHGKLNDLLNELNGFDQWRLIYGNASHNKHKKDVLYILRYMALYHDNTEYKKPMKEFLSKFMKKHQDEHEPFLLDEEKRFKKTCETIIKHLGEKPLHNKKNTLNPSLFDAVFIAFAKNIDNIPHDIKTRLTELLNDELFLDYVNRATTDTKIIPLRLELAETKLFR